MKRFVLYIAILSLLAGCEDVLDKKDLGGISDADVWDDPSLANLYLNKVYQQVLPGFGGTANTNISDESTGTGTGRMMYGELTIDDNYGSWGVTTYSNIRTLNVLIDEIEKGSMREEDRVKIKGQGLFLRAWEYFELVKYYGGVPLVLHQQDPFAGSELFVPRNSASQCIAQIVADLDEAILSLPDSWPTEEWGRITKGAAAAFKGRVLLFYASPQFNPDNLKVRWDSAYSANVKAKEICSQTYSLHSDFGDIFLDEEESTEAIFVKIFNGVEVKHGYENSVRPFSEADGGSSNNCPTWELVCAFPMNDGLPITNHPNYDTTYFWKNRDPRFYETIAYNGCDWPLSGKSTRKQWDYVGNGIEPPSPELGASNTGFYCRKNVDESIVQTETGNVGTDWIEIRYTEVLLNLAECAAELGYLEEALVELRAIRERAGIEAGDGNYGITASTELEMVEAVMHERRIEMAFENKRHWDLRRRNMYVNDLGNTPKLNGTYRHGISIQLDTDYIISLNPTRWGTADSAIMFFNDSIRDIMDVETEYHLYFITEYDWNRDEMPINFRQPEYNFYYLPQSDLDENPFLIQTIHWGNGTFDPLEN